MAYLKLCNKSVLVLLKSSEEFQHGLSSRQAPTGILHRGTGLPDEDGTINGQHTPHMCNMRHSHLSLCLLFRLVGNRPRFDLECLLEGVVGCAGEERGAASVLVLVVLGERGDEVSVVLGCAVEVLVIRTCVCMREEAIVQALCSIS